MYIYKDNKDIYEEEIYEDKEISVIKKYMKK